MREQLLSARGLRWLAGAVVVGAVVWFFGADVAHSILIAALVLGCAVVWAAVPQHALTGMRGLVTRPGGGRSDVTSLAWALRGRRGRVGLQATSRLRGIARTRLARLQLDLDDPAHRPAIEALLGTPVTTVLVGGRRRQPSLRSVLRSLDALQPLTPPWPPAAAGPDQVSAAAPERPPAVAGPDRRSTPS